MSFARRRLRHHRAIALIKDKLGGLPGLDRRVVRTLAVRPTRSSADSIEATVCGDN